MVHAARVVIFPPLRGRFEPLRNTRRGGTAGGVGLPRVVVSNENDHRRVEIERRSGQELGPALPRVRDSRRLDLDREPADAAQKRAESEDLFAFSRKVQRKAYVRDGRMLLAL